MRIFTLANFVLLEMFQTFMYYLFFNFFKKSNGNPTCQLFAKK